MIQEIFSGGVAANPQLTDTIENTQGNTVEVSFEGLAGGTDAEQITVMQNLLSVATLGLTLKVGSRSETICDDEIPLSFHRRLANQEGGFIDARDGASVDLGFLPIPADTKLRAKLDLSRYEHPADSPVSIDNLYVYCDLKDVDGDTANGIVKTYEATDQEKKSYTHPIEVENLRAAYLIGGALKGVRKTRADNTSGYIPYRIIKKDSAMNTRHESESESPLLRVHLSRGHSVYEGNPTLKVEADTGSQLVQLGVERL